MTRRIAILGSTGSIGTQALAVIDALNADGGDFQVVALAANRNVELLAEQARRYRPKWVGIVDESADVQRFAALCGAPGGGVPFELRRGPGVLAELAAHPEVDIVLHAVVGAAGLRASFAAAQAGKTIALANKESLVVGGALLMDAVRRGGAMIIPVDSEHSAVFQAIQCGRREEIDRILLTASGGPFRTWPIERIASATVEDALAHPTWNMGGRITVASATMFNKALEIIEAVHLFDLPAEKIHVVIHPESVIHSMVEFCDGSVMAQLSPPDMKTPIGYALTYPARGRPGGRRMDWSQAHALRFEPPDPARFPALDLAREALAAGGTAPAVLNAANEVAVTRFLARELPFGRITEVVRSCMQQLPGRPVKCLEDLLEADSQARILAQKLPAGSNSPPANP